MEKKGVNLRKHFVKIFIDSDFFSRIKSIKFENCINLYFLKVPSVDNDTI